MARVLVADDDGHIREVVRYALEREGHQVLEASNGREALELADEGRVDLIVLDIVMPEEDGLEVCRRIRAKSSLPILFLSSKDEEIDRILGLELGADDYITKPFSPRELSARVKAVLRRVAPAPTTTRRSSSLRHGLLDLDLERHECSWDGAAVELSVTEFSLLEVLLSRPGKVYSRGELVQRGYGQGFAITERTIDSHIRHIRKKLSAAGGKDLIETVYGVGYRLSDVGTGG